MGAAELKAKKPNEIRVIKIQHQRISPDVISVVLEYLSSAKHFLRLRQVCKKFDTAAFRIKLNKLN